MGEIGEGGIEWQKKTKQWMKIVCSHIRKGKKKSTRKLMGELNWMGLVGEMNINWGSY